MLMEYNTFKINDDSAEDLTIFTGNILRQPMCSGIEKRVLEEGYPNADAVMERGVLLPLHHGLTDSMFERFQNTVDDFISKYT